MTIDDYLYLAPKIAKWFQIKNPHKADDILGQAYLGLCQAWEWRDRAPEHFVPYAIVTIKRFITDFLEVDHTVPLPRDQWKKRFENDEFIPKTICDEDEYILSSVDPDNITYNETLDHITKEDDRDKIIVEELMKNKTYREIAEMLGVSHVMVHHRIKVMRERYAKYSEIWRPLRIS